MFLIDKAGNSGRASKLDPGFRLTPGIRVSLCGRSTTPVDCMSDSGLGLRTTDIAKMAQTMTNDGSMT